jgi:hypothetical protein
MTGAKGNVVGAAHVELWEGGGLETTLVEWWPLSCCGLSEEMRFALATATNRARGRR